MRPGQTTPNDFERAILERIADQEPSIRASIASLHVLSREYTGVGSFTRFLCDDLRGKWDRHIGLNVLIRMPGVPDGMGAVLFCKGSSPECLETYSFGNDHWDGVHEGFSIDGQA